MGSEEVGENRHFNTAHENPSSEHESFVLLGKKSLECESPIFLPLIRKGTPISPNMKPHWCITPASVQSLISECERVGTLTPR